MGISDCRPALIALPGFVHESEQCRVDDLLTLMEKEEGIKPCRVAYSAIERSENKIICHFNLERYLADISTSIEHAHEDCSNIFVFASSMSAAIVGHYIAQHPENHGISAYVSISPLPGWEQYANEKIRARILQEHRNVALTGKFDLEKKISRYIPSEDISQVQKVDSLQALSVSPPIKSLQVLTFIGTEDEVTSPEKMRQYHKVLGGKAEGIRECPCGHDMPRNAYELEVAAFFKQYLLNRI